MRISDWSSDVCSSDLIAGLQRGAAACRRGRDIGLRAVEDAGRGGIAVAVIVEHHRIARAVVDELQIAAAVVGEGLHPAIGEIDPLDAARARLPDRAGRSEEHTSELQSLMRISYAVFCLKNKIQDIQTT